RLQWVYLLLRSARPTHVSAKDREPDALSERTEEGSWNLACKPAVISAGLLRYASVLSPVRFRVARPEVLLRACGSCRIFTPFGVPQVVPPEEWAVKIHWGALNISPAKIDQSNERGGERKTSGPDGEAAQRVHIVIALKNVSQVRQGPVR